MHHVPGGQERGALLEKMAARLGPGGRLAVSFWQFGGDERFQRRMLAWGDLEEIDAGELEPGDFLLRWGSEEEDSTARRYCHYCDPQEAKRLVDRADLELIDSFRADGRTDDLNLYLLLARRD